MKNWFWDGTFIDHGEASYTCELCSQVGLRYHFPIINEKKDEIKYIGSECILAYDVSAKAKDGKVLHRSEIRDKINTTKNHIKKQNKLNDVLGALRTLVKKDDKFQNIFKSFIDYYLEKDYFTPKQLSVIAWRLKEHKVEHKKKSFKMSIKRNTYKEQLENLKDWQIKEMKPYMSNTQRDYCDEQL